MSLLQPSPATWCLSLCQEPQETRKGSGRLSSHLASSLGPSQQPSVRVRRLEVTAAQTYA